MGRNFAGSIPLQTFYENNQRKTDTTFHKMNRVQRKALSWNLDLKKYKYWDILSVCFMKVELFYSTQFYLFSSEVLENFFTFKKFMSQRMTKGWYKETVLIIFISFKMYWLWRGFTPLVKKSNPFIFGYRWNNHVKIK